MRLEGLSLPDLERLMTRIPNSITMWATTEFFFN